MPLIRRHLTYKHIVCTKFILLFSIIFTPKGLREDGQLGLEVLLPVTIEHLLRKEGKLALAAS